MVKWGSVPTAAQIRKDSEKAAAKLWQTSAAAVPAPVAPAPKGKFSFSSDEFAPLGKGASASFEISSWGQKSAPVEASAHNPNSLYQNVTHDEHKNEPKEAKSQMVDSYHGVLCRLVEYVHDEIDA
jgi:hypothetical protein